VATDGGPRGSFIGNSFVYIQFGYYYIQRCARGFVARLIFRGMRACVVIILYIYTGINHVHKVSRAEEYTVILYMYTCMCVCGWVWLGVCTCTVDVPVEGAYLRALHNNTLNSRSPTDRVGTYIHYTYHMYTAIYSIYMWWFHPRWCGIRIMWTITYNIRVIDALCAWKKYAW